MSIIKTKKTGTLIVLSGPTSAGKGTIGKELLQRNKNLWFSVSMTTRKPRFGEQDGVEYYFVSKEEFEDRIEKGKFLEYAIVHNNDYYGTPKDKIIEMLNNGNDVLLEIDIQGVSKIKDKFSEAIYIFIMPPSMKILKERLEKRGSESHEKQIERIKTAYKEINEVTKYNYVVVNDEVDKATTKVEAILLAEKCRVDRIEDVELDSIEEDMHEFLTK